MFYLSNIKKADLLDERQCRGIPSRHQFTMQHDYISMYCYTYFPGWRKCQDPAPCW